MLYQLVTTVTTSVLDLGYLGHPCAIGIHWVPCCQAKIANCGDTWPLPRFATSRFSNWNSLNMLQYLHINYTCCCQGRICTALCFARRAFPQAQQQLRIFPKDRTCRRPGDPRRSQEIPGAQRNPKTCGNVERWANTGQPVSHYWSIYEMQCHQVYHIIIYIQQSSTSIIYWRICKNIFGRTLATCLRRSSVAGKSGVTRCHKTSEYRCGFQWCNLDGTWKLRDAQITNGCQHSIQAIRMSVVTFLQPERQTLTKEPSTNPIQAGVKMVFK